MEDLTLRVVGRVQSTEAIGRIVVRQRDGHAIRVEDVARVEDGRADETTYAQLDRDRTVVLSVIKQSGKNTVNVVDAVKARLSQVERSLPEGTKLEIRQLFTDDDFASVDPTGELREHDAKLREQAEKQHGKS